MAQTIRAFGRKFANQPYKSSLLVTSSLVATGFAFDQYSRSPLVADSSSNTSSAWRGTSTVVGHNSSLKERATPFTAAKQDLTEKDGSGPTPPPQTKGHATLKKDNASKEEVSAWQTATDRIATLSDGITGFDFATIRDQITDMVLPSWLKMLPGLIKKVQDEISMAPWSLGWEIWEEAHDPQINPEIILPAQVRLSTKLCSEELAFLQKRRVQTVVALARYLDIKEADIHPDDVPTIAICGSGGGLRALVAGTSSYLSARQAGLFDCATYTAGVSGSCWLQTLFYSSIGQTSHEKMLQHMKNRLGVHIAYPPAALKLLTEAPTNRFLLSGIVEKLKGEPDAEFGLVDVYGLLLAARLLVPRGELTASDWDLKVSNQRYFVDDGDQPLPIYTAVRHEISDSAPESAPSANETADVKHNNYFQWFEWTPYELFSEELQAGVPTWAVGRKFNGGVSVVRENGLSLPEVKVPLLMGIWGSAFCATLSHYYHEVSPILQASGWTGLDSMLKTKDEDLIKIHPLDPASIPNFALGMREKLPDTCPESIHTAEHLRLMDAGMSNNLPIYPLLRPGRDIDVVVAFDVSADAPIANWIKVVEGYAKQRGIKGWPMGAGWPPRSNSEDQTLQQLDAAEAASQAGDHDNQPEISVEDLGHCTVWVGSTVERTQDQDGYAARRMSPQDEEWHLSSEDAGIAVVYFPFLANDKVPGVDPLTSDYMSTWNFVYTPEEIDKVVALAKANFEEGAEQTRRVVRAVYERKRGARLEREEQESELRMRMLLRRGQPIGKEGEGDHFS